MEELTYWVNGAFVPASQAVIPLEHRGFRQGDAVFDTERTFNGRIFKLAEHLARLERSLRYARIDPGLTMAELAEASEEAVARNRHLLERCGDFWVTQIVARGQGPSPAQAGRAFVAVTLRVLPFAKMAPFYSAGVPLAVPSIRTNAVGGLDPKVKAVSRMQFALADLEAKQRDPEAFALMLDERGNLAEVVSGNVFLVRDGMVRTPSERAILEGVSRATTIALCREAGLRVEEGEWQPYDLLTADEAFVTTTSICLLPVRSLNGTPIGAGVPGPVTRRVTAAWNALAGLDIAEQYRTYAARPAVQAVPEAVAR